MSILERDVLRLLVLGIWLKDYKREKPVKSERMVNWNG